MTTLVSLALNNANRLPIVGSPIGQATTWYRTRSNSNSSSSEILCETPPPPYEKEPVHSRLGLISDYVLKRAASFSSSSAPLPQQKETLSVTAVEQQALDKKQVDEGITLIQMATKMNSEVSATSGAGAGAGNSYQMSMDLYLMGLDKILNSIPVDADPTIKSNLESKLLEFKQKNGLALQEEHTGKKKLTEEEQNEALRGLSNLIIHAAVLSAVALKKSPIPGIMSKVFQLTKDVLLKLDETYSIRERTMNLTSVGISKAIELDQHYEVHQFFAELFYTGCTAILKAGIAYAEHNEAPVTIATTTAITDA